MSDERQMNEATQLTNAEQTRAVEEKMLLDKYSHSFLGSYAHSLDSKGRLVVPQAFREDLGESFMICPSLDFKSICLYTNLEWARTRDFYAQMGRLSAQFSKCLNLFDALSYRGQECDNQGRVLLPAKIRQLVLGDEKDVEITGAMDHVRVVTAALSKQLTEDVIASGDLYQQLFDELSARVMNDRR